MRKTSLSRLKRTAYVLVGGGMLLQVSSCSDEVMAAFLSGAEGTAVTIANALIAAIFEGLV